MGRVYSAQVNGVAATAAQDVFELLTPADLVVCVHSVFIGQTTDAGDAEAEMLGVQIKRGSGSITSGSGGSTPSMFPHVFSDTAASCTLEANNTTIAVVGAGALSILQAESFNVQAGWYYTPTPEERIWLSPSQYFIVTMTAPADSITLNARIVFEEIGG